MGFRSTMVTEDIGLDIPQWFVDKHPDIHFGEYGELAREEYRGKPKLPMSYKWEHKWHSEFLEDLQKVVQENTDDIEDVELVFFHECDGITKVKVGKDKIQYFEPQEWEEVEDITHSYCYGCSEPKDTNQLQGSRNDK